MLRRIRRRLTFANVCSFLALTIALSTGGAYAANTVFSTDIVDGEVKHADLAANSVTSTNIYNGSVLGPEIHADAVDSSKVADESLTSSDLGTDSVNATEIADSSIDGGEIIDNSLGAIDLAPGAAGSSELAANSVDSSKVTNESLTTADLAGSAVNGSVSLSGIANGRCTQVTFNVGGAAVGDSAIVSTRAAIQNGILMYANRVASAGHVEVNACNFSGTAMTAISAFPVRVITFR
ncbi:MAG TPA: hypothetical protein VGI54_09980 [Solirubrobacteraceae bacterium]